MLEINKEELIKKKRRNNQTFQNCRDKIFGKNSIILRKNQASRNIYHLRQGQAAIVDQKDQILYTYKQGSYLNFIQSSLQLGTFKTIKAIKKCHISLQIWNKTQVDFYKKQTLIPKRQQIRFYQVPMLFNLSYQLTLELSYFFNLQKVLKMENFKFQFNYTYFIVEGALLVIDFKTNKRILKLQKGQMFKFNQAYKYALIGQFCQLIKISTQLFYAILGQKSAIFQEIQTIQLKELNKRNCLNQKINKKINSNYQKYINKAQQVPQKFKNQIQIKTEKLQRAKSVNYINNNKNFTSFSDQKRKILQNRDQGYKKISQLNRRRYGRNYILQKRLQISRNIYQGKNSPTNQSQNYLKRGITLYQSVTLKDDYGIMKKRSFLNMVKKKKDKINIKQKSKEKQIDNITLKEVKTFRQKFQKKSKSLYNFCAKKHVLNFF